MILFFFIFLNLFIINLHSENINLLEKITQKELVNIEENIKYKRSYFNMKNRGIYKKCLPEEMVINKNISANVNQVEIDKKLPNEDEFRDNLYNKLKKNKEIENWVAKFIAYDTKIIPKVSFFQQNQPAMVSSFKDYLGAKRKNLLSDVLKNACNYYKKHIDVFDLTSDLFNINSEYILAILGLETNFGKVPLRYNLFDALFSNAYLTPERKVYFTKELINAGKLLSYNAVKKTSKSSFDGGIGICQFMPFSYLKYAMSYEIDKIPDLTNHNDAIVSVAHYLFEFGWNKNEINESFLNVNLSNNFDLCLAGFKEGKTLNEWRKYLKITDNIDKNLDNDLFYLYIPDIEDDKIQDKDAFLVSDSFLILMNWNPAPKYIITILILASEIKKALDLC